MVSVCCSQFKAILENVFCCCWKLSFSPNQIVKAVRELKIIIIRFLSRKRLNLMQTCKFFQYSSFSVQDSCRYINFHSNSRATSWKNTHLFKFNACLTFENFLQETWKSKQRFLQSLSTKVGILV